MAFKGPVHSSFQLFWLIRPQLGFKFGRAIIIKSEPAMVLEMLCVQ